MTDVSGIILTIGFLKQLLIVAFLAFTGFGFGFVVGLLLANRFIGRGFPMKFETHQENARKAGEHNKQWHPENERWQDE